MQLTLVIGAILACLANVNGQSCDGTQTFRRIKIDTEKGITWTVEKDCPKATYEIKEKRWNKWISLGTVKSKGNGTNQYAFSLAGACDIYEIRIELKGNRRCRSLPFENAAAPSTTGYVVGETNIVFTSSTRFEVFSTEGIRILKGCAEKVRIAELKKGTYYLNYGKMMVKFVKK